ncbi:ABC transporter ATP-binding protein/permease [Acuticoccus sp. M5D2P5]|uniref:ABC transporter ATP-binding protein n=1 Tax=Acuticoccus kalidii TaxID=2910977 RepID=UPI001F47BC5B|nr:ABC transporter ATP-binding protein [Acuticoccus kalidii]MCF3933806.1 ABC transporter ATP-binding protein/permease [Acuticoccus kalidii]
MRRLWDDYLVQHRSTLALAIVAIVFVAASTSLYPLIINWAFDSFAAKSPWAINTLPWLVLLAAGGKSISLYAQVSLTQRVVTQAETDMQRALYKHLVAADLAQISQETPAAWTQRFTTDLLYIRLALVRIVTVLLRDGLTIVALFGTMIYLDWQLCLIAAVILPLALIPVTRIGRRLRRVSSSTQEHTGGMASLTSETFGAARVVKTYRLEPYLESRADAAFEKLRRLRLKAALQKGRMEPVLEALGGLAVTVILLVIGWRIMGGTRTIGEFSGFLGALLLASQPIRALGNLNALVQEGLAALNRYYAVLDTPPMVEDRPGAVPATFGADAIAFDGVTFGYRASAPALHEVRFEAKAGETTAFVGRSGAGKSTIFNLIPRLYDPTGGRILIGGHDIQSMTIESLRERIAVVSQDIVLFNDTVAQNIRLGRSNATDEEIVAAARHAGAHDFIMRHQDGYEAMVGERGGNFSGGERQRIALARAFLKDAPVLLLDEATSALDAESEALVRDALARLSKGRTTLVIAHRLSTVRAAEKIIVLDAGRVAETGTHRELVEAGGLYARFHHLQLAED